MRKLLAVLLCLGLVGCATGYHSKGFTGGYSDMRIQDDIFRVTFHGNGYAGRERTGDFALLRSAELTLENGYKYFVILDSNTDIRTSAYTTPVTAQTYGSVNMYGNNGSYNGTTYYSGGQTYIMHKPSVSMTFQCFKDKPTGVSGMVYDAEQIKTNIRQAYKLN